MSRNILWFNSENYANILMKFSAVFEETKSTLKKPFIASCSLLRNDRNQSLRIHPLNVHVYVYDVDNATN